MKSQTEQLLATLEVLAGSPIYWETATQGEFSFWKLLNITCSVKETDLELVFEHWQKMETWGTPTDRHRDDCEYAPTRTEREDENQDNDDWNDKIAIERNNLYDRLQQLLSSNFTHLQAYKIYHTGSDRGSSFEISIVVGETLDRQWLCLAPTIPDRVTDYEHRSTKLKIEPTSNPNRSDLDEIVHRLTPLKMYGYYHGGYNYTYQHQIHQAIAPTKDNAIELALQLAGAVSISQPTIEYKNDNRVSEFMNKCLLDRTRYTMSLWDVCYTFEIAKTPDKDWIGIKSAVEFEYNP
jgi:hypothetical protein